MREASIAIVTTIVLLFASSCGITNLLKEDTNPELTLSKQVNEQIGSNIFCRNVPVFIQYYKYIFKDLGLFKAQSSFDSDSLYIVEEINAGERYLSVVSIPDDKIITYYFESPNRRPKVIFGIWIPMPKRPMSYVFKNVIKLEFSYSEMSKIRDRTCLIIEKALGEPDFDASTYEQPFRTDFYNVLYSLTKLERYGYSWRLIRAHKIGVPGFDEYPELRIYHSIQAEIRKRQSL